MPAYGRSWIDHSVYVVRVFWTRCLKKQGVLLARWFHFKQPFAANTIFFLNS